MRINKGRETAKVISTLKLYLEVKIKSLLNRIIENENKKGICTKYNENDIDPSFVKNELLNKVPKGENICIPIISKNAPIVG